MAVGTPQTNSKVKDAFHKASERTALRGIANRILGGTSGTAAYYGVGLAIGTAAVTGVGWTNPVSAVIDGVKVDIASTLNIAIPASLGTQPTNTFCKYLVYNMGTSGTGFIAKGNEALTAAAAKLPDLPDGGVALGYFQVNSTAGAWTAGTGMDSAGATITYQDLICMPIDG
jgi:hypothetical protein